MRCHDAFLAFWVFGVSGVLLAALPGRARDSQPFFQRFVPFGWVPFRSWMFRPWYLAMIRVQGILALVAAIFLLRWYLQHCGH